MKKKLLILVVSLLLCISMLASVVLMVATMANGDATSQKNPFFQNLANETPTFNTSTPLALYDFTNDDLEITFANASGVTYAFTKGEYVTFTATDNDPYLWIETPMIKPSDAKFVSVKHRGQNLSGHNFEVFCTYTGKGNMAEATNHFAFPLTSTGDWSIATSACTAWANCDTSAYFEIMRFDPIADGAGSKDKSIDVQYVAFFASEADANSFNFEQYKAKLEYEKNPPSSGNQESTASGSGNNTKPNINTNGLDLSDGTLQYKVSADGSTVTISYEVNGERRSYTVPNKNNFTSGGFAATDDLDRSLYTANEVGLYGSNGERYTGLFYFLWHGMHGDSGVFDLQKIIDEIGVEAAGNTSCGKYGPQGAMHWFAEPLYGYYYASDAWVLRKHAELLCNINIDFLYFDVTNRSTYLSNAKKLMEVLHQLNEEGYDAPQIVFYTNTDSTGAVREVYNAIYAKNYLPDTWFCIDGKPVIIAPESDNIDGFFTTKQNQWPNEASKANGWPWMDFSWPARVFYDNNGKNGAISVSVAQHCGTIAFSSSSLYGNNSNRGRSFYDPYDGDSTFNFDTGKKSKYYPRALQQSYSAWQKDPSVTNQGLNFQAQWDHAIASDAKYVLVTGWNEWVAQRQPTTDGSIHFVDTSSMEFSRDCEMMRGGYFDNYYIQLAYNVQKLNGAAPVIVQDARMPIDVNASFSQWNAVPVTYTDPSGDTMNRNSLGFGRQKYTNETGRNDIVSSKVVTDSKYIYFYVETKNNITAYNDNSSWMQLYLNADSDNTGWYGYDYIINYSAKSANKTTVAEYIGRDNKYTFRNIGEVTYQVSGNKMMIAVPLSMVALDNYKEINIQFKWADSTTTYNEMEDFYIDGDAAPLGRLNYIYQNYIPGESVITYPGQPETEASTVIAADTQPDDPMVETDTAGDAETSVDTDGEDKPVEANTDTTMDTDADEGTQANIDTTVDGTSDIDNTENMTDDEGDTDSGCSSVVALTSMTMMGMIALGAICLKKKD